MSMSPIHVHVQDNTPLHLHVKKPKFSDISKQEVKRSNVRPGQRSKTKSITEPWIPAPGRTSTRDRMDKNYKWGSEKAQLEINQPLPEQLRETELSTEEDNKLRSYINDYEKKVESLMAEVGSLKNETRNFNLQIASNDCESCSGDVMIAENQNNLRSCPIPLREIENYCDCLPYAKSDECFKKDKRVKVKQVSDDRGKCCCEELLNSSSGQHSYDELPVKDVVSDSAAPFKIDKCGDGSKSDETKVDYKCSQPLQRAGKVSYADWGNSFGIHKADSNLELKKVEKTLEDKEEQLEMSKAVLEDRHKELRFLANEFEETEKENARLRKSMEKYHDDLATSLDKLDVVPTDGDLPRQLVEVEVCGAEAGKQVAALRDIIQRLKYEKRLSHSDVNALNKQRELFLQKLEEFETSNRTVRRLLQTEHKTLSDVKRLETQRDTLMKKMADSDSDILRLRSELIKRNADLEQLVTQVTEEKNHTRTLNELNKSVEATRAHLQRELRTKEMENNRLHVQLKNIERETGAIRDEAERVSGAAKSERETLAIEKEGLKRAARSLRNRAEKAEEGFKDAEFRLADRERKLEEARSQADAWRDRYQRASDEKARLEDHMQSLADKVTEKESMSRTNEILLRNKEEELKKQLDRLTSENVRFRSDIERYKTEVSVTEEKCRQAQQEASSLRSDVRQQESVENDLRAQLRKAKSEAEEALLSVEKVERNSRRMREDGSSEIERVREQMLERMKDLQPLPELLKETEMKLQDAQDKLHVYEQRSAEQSRMIAELSNKDGVHSDEVTALKQRLIALTEENRALEARLQILHVKLDDRDLRVKESVLDTVNKDERLQQIQLKFEEVNHERDSLRRQLDAAMCDSRKAVDAEIDKAVARDHANQSRIVDLETQITRMKADIATMKRSKEDTERRNQSKLQDAKDRLEQAESTNRSMRNYVNFLKKSYTNVFGAESSLTSTPIRSGPSDAPNTSFY